MKVGEWVRVRDESEILSTLDEKSQLDGMPFMPEMLKYCGRRFQVLKVAHKACDTAFPVRARSIARSVHLNLRCEGSAHGGCQAGCLIYWKHEWLERVGGPAPETAVGSPTRVVSDMRKTDIAKIVANGVQRSNEAGETVFVCQATQLPYASTHLPWWDLRQYVTDYRSGNVSLSTLLAGLVYSTYYRLSEAGIGLRRPLLWIYNRTSWLWGGSLWPRTPGRLQVGSKTPERPLDLQPGELVRVKPFDEILDTITADYKNRGMYWDAEMVPFCGKTYRVHRRVTQIIEEKTGKMLDMKSPGIVLENVICGARYSHCRMFCPRGIYPFWREIWLERLPPLAAQSDRKEWSMRPD